MDMICSAHDLDVIGSNLVESKLGCDMEHKIVAVRDTTGQHLYVSKMARYVQWETLYNYVVHIANFVYRLYSGI